MKPRFRAFSAIAGLALAFAGCASAQFAYITNNGSSNVSVINTATNTVVATVNVGSGPYSGPYGVAVNPAGTFVYVANVDGNSVSVINTATNTVTATVALPVGTSPYGVAVNPAGTFVYVANPVSGTVSVIIQPPTPSSRLWLRGTVPWGLPSIRPAPSFT